MSFYLYLFFSLILILFLLAFIFSFGLPHFKGAPYAVTNKRKIDRIISLLSKRVKDGKVVDLGSGDGRLVIALAEQGYQVQGYEINPFLSFLSQKRIKKYKLGHKAFINRKDYWQEDLSSYRVVVVFGVFYMMPKLEKKLKRELESGAVVISNYFRFPNWKPREKKNGVYVYIK